MQFRCGSMSCHRSECKGLFWSRRVRLLTALIGEYALSKFFTLTLDPKFVEGDAWAYISYPWSKFRKRMARRCGAAWKFAAVLEGHKSRDVPHIHGFTDVWIHQRDWSTMWHASCGGSVVWVEKVESEGLSEYVHKQIEVAKYVGKAQLESGYKHRDKLRTLYRSQGLKAKFELTTSTEWCIVKENIYRDDGSLTDWASQKGIWSNGEKEQQGQDMETACRTVLEPCS